MAGAACVPQGRTAQSQGSLPIAPAFLSDGTAMLHSPAHGHPEPQVASPSSPPACLPGCGSCHLARTRSSTPSLGACGKPMSHARLCPRHPPVGRAPSTSSSGTEASLQMRRRNVVPAQLLVEFGWRRELSRCLLSSSCWSLRGGQAGKRPGALGTHELKVLPGQGIAVPAGGRPCGYYVGPTWLHAARPCGTQ